MYKPIFSLAAVLLIIAGNLNLVAQPRAYEEKGASLIREASARLRSYNNVEARFTYTMENTSMEHYEALEGILYSSGDKFRMQVGGNLFVSDGESVWSYLEEVNEVHVSLAEDADMNLTPTAILRDMEENFRARFVRQESIDGNLADIVDLVPNEPQAFFKYRVALNANDRHLIYTIAYDRHGGTYTYQISRMEVNHTIDPSLFRFDAGKHPGLEVIDLR